MYDREAAKQFSEAYNEAVKELERAHADLTKISEPFLDEKVIKTDGSFYKKLAEPWNKYLRQHPHIRLSKATYSVAIEVQKNLKRNDDRFLMNPILTVWQTVFNIENGILTGFVTFDLATIPFKVVDKAVSDYMEAKLAFKAASDKLDGTLPYALRDIMQSNKII